MSLASTVAIAGGVLSLVGNVLAFLYGGAVAPKHEVQDVVAINTPSATDISALRQAKIWGWIGFGTTAVGGAVAIVGSALGS